MNKIFFAFLIGMAITSCTVMMYPSQSSEMIKRVTDVAASIDNLYLQISESEDKSYELFASYYINIESEINTIILFDAIRPNSEDLVKIANLLKEHFIKYKDDHKSRTLNNAELRTYNNYLKAFCQSLLEAEKHLK